ncbi:MAG: hypothetical protein NW220_24555 [Leptolyngbyaceae cyanobacterium bins.349]|nr:hypothetical protein [Leptolyngbyaceae cyanobacterium bins.349]
MLPMRVPVSAAIALLVALSGSVDLSTTAAQATPHPSPRSTATAPVNSRLLAQKTGNDLTDLEPEVGVIRRIQQGDTMCYITFTDESGKSRTVGAMFEFCENPRQYLNQRMRLVYGIRSVNDCQSEEPCGKTRRTHLVIRMDAVDRAGRTVSASDAVVLRNRDWTIAIGNRNSWSGVNGTGNLTYRGCNTRQQCLNLKGGTISCRNGVCATTWRNGEYSYTLSSAITDGSRPTASTLTVRRNNQVLQQITGLK